MARSDRRVCEFNQMDGRNCGRKHFNEMLPTALCKTIDSEFVALICNISSNGAFVKTARKFSVGQEVAMTISFPFTGESRMVTGVIARVSPRGFGVNFKVFFKD